MKKAAIITIVSRNYGNRLQNFALQETLKKMGIYVETLPMRNGKGTPKEKAKYRIKLFLHYATGAYADIAWEKFDNRIVWGKCLNDKTLQELIARYDSFIAGSDQIWNPLFKINTDRELLTFVPSLKRIAYAASIGLSEFPEEHFEHYSSEWKKFHAISVREDQAADIVQQGTGNRPQVVLDPTMLLKKEEWEKILKPVRKHRKFYVSYFLGNHVAEYDASIKKYVFEKNCDLVELTDNAGNINPNLGPAEFLGFLHDAQGVFTDSYHGTVFSILFQKPFLVYERATQKGYGNMNSRIDTLLNTFKLQEHKISYSIDEKDMQTEWDLLAVEKVLNLKRSEAQAFLKQALDL